MKQIAIIGGSFNPVTLGHVQMALEVAKLPNIDGIWFVPNYNSVFEKNLVEFRHRVDMLELAIADLKFENKGFGISTIEGDQNLPGYTLDLVEALEEKYKDRCEFYYVIGQDIANNIGSYRYYRTLIKTVKFIVFPRKPYLPVGDLWYMSGEHTYLKSIENIIEVSSTEVRQIIKKADIDNGRARLLLQDKLNPGVIDYILKNKLYK